MELKIEKVNYYQTLENKYLPKNDSILEKKEIPSKTSQNEPSENKNSPGILKGLSDLGDRRLSILQDIESQRYVYRQIDHETKLITKQYPNETELARIAFLNKIEEVALKKITRETKE